MVYSLCKLKEKQEEQVQRNMRDFYFRNSSTFIPRFTILSILPKAVINSYETSKTIKRRKHERDKRVLIINFSIKMKRDALKLRGQFLNGLTPEPNPPKICFIRRFVKSQS